MTSASNRPAAVPATAARIDAATDRIASDWGHHSHTGLSAMLAELYSDLAVLPPRWTSHQRTEAIADAADTTTSELTALLDDYIHHEADHSPITDYGTTPHTDDRHHAITAMLTALIEEHLTWWLTTGLADFIADLDPTAFVRCGRGC